MLGMTVFFRGTREEEAVRLVNRLLFPPLTVDNLSFRSAARNPLGIAGSTSNCNCGSKSFNRKYRN